MCTEMANLPSPANQNQKNNSQSNYTLSHKCTCQPIPSLKKYSSLILHFVQIRCWLSWVEVPMGSAGPTWWDPSLWKWKCWGLKLGRLCALSERFTLLLIMELLTLISRKLTLVLMKKITKLLGFLTTRSMTMWRCSPKPWFFSMITP